MLNSMWALFLFAQLLAEVKSDIACPDGFYAQVDRCLPCDSSCKTCSLKSNNCLSCYDGKYIEEGGSTCVDCLPNCKSCSNSGACLECKDGFYSDQNPISSCNPCESQCDTCGFAYVGYDYVYYCKTCASGYREKGPGNNGVSDEVECEKCTSGCLSCPESAQKCEKCAPNYNQNGDICELCDTEESHCQTCQGGAKNCTSCQNGFYLEVIENIGKCKDCQRGCSVCTDSTYCTICSEGFYQENGECKDCNTSCKKCHDNTNMCDECADGFHMNSLKQCIKCTENCIECTSSECMRCKSHYFLDAQGLCSECNSECTQCKDSADNCINCPDGTYLSEAFHTCIKCDKACEKCDGPTASHCTNCAKGYYFDDWYFDVPTCISCEPGCSSCTGVYECDECFDGFYLFESDNYGDTNKDCQRCPIGCSKCSKIGENVVCSECAIGYYESGKDGDSVSCTRCSDTNCKKCQSKDICNECQDGYYLNNGQCAKCESPCATCNAPGNVCTSCVGGHLLKGNSCEAKCDPSCASCEGSPEKCTSCANGYVLVDNKCKECQEGCLTCEYNNGVPYCTSCIDGYAMKDEKCMKCDLPCTTCIYGFNAEQLCYECAHGYFKRTTFYPYYAYKCMACDSSAGTSNCIECASSCTDEYNCEFICTRCADGFYLENNKCLECHSTCKTCFGEGEEKCYECKEGYYESNGKCAQCNPLCFGCDETGKCTSCPTHQYLVDGECRECSNSCAECKDKDDYCTECTNQFAFDGKCYASCIEIEIEGGYGSIDGKTCEKCNLDHCIEYDDSCQCTKCSDGYGVVTDYSTENQIEICVECVLENCKTCSGTEKNDCTECLGGYFLFEDQDTHNKICSGCRAENCNKCASNGLTCVECKDGYYANSEGICEECQNNCIKCNGPDTCELCKDGYYANSEGVCEECKNNCIKCKGPDTCELCKDGYYADSSAKCQPCTPPCATCKESPTRCFSCIEGYELDGAGCRRTAGECLDQNCGVCDINGKCILCKGGYGFDNVETCVKCPDSCETCGYYYSYGEMACKTCKPSYYPVILGDPTFPQCMSCNGEYQSGCLKCTTHDRCEVCFDNYYLNSQDSKCLPCNEPCETCKDEATKCLTCIEGYRVDESTNKCIACPKDCRHCDSSNKCTECIDHYYPSGTGCSQCDDSNCLKCSDASTCIDCMNGFYVDGQNKCSPCGDNCIECTSEKCTICKHEFYPAEGTSCQPCAEVCSECSGPSAQECISCDPGYFFSKPNRNCFKCNEACANCTGPNADECEGCSVGYFFGNGMCNRCEVGCKSCETLRMCNECKDGFYLTGNYKDQDCQPCAAGCMTCEKTGDHQCTKCFPGYHQTAISGTPYVNCSPCPDNCQSCQEQNGQLVCTDCRDGFYKEGEVCTRCNLACTKCTSKDVCSECAPGYLYQNSKCETRCSENCLGCEGTTDNCVSCRNGFVLNGNKCESCPEGCQICETHSGSSMCLSCQDGFYKDGYECKACDSTCATCAAEGSRRCYTCQKGYYKYKEFNYPYIYAGECHTCEEGAANCVECESECLDDHVDSTGECTFRCNKCRPGHFLSDSSTCSSCPPNCFECTDSNTCVKCNAGYILNGTVCDSTCAENSHCDLDNGNGTDYGNYVGEDIKYDGTESPSNGGALRIINNGVSIINSSFTGCKSTEGAGGGIYIHNNIEDETKQYTIEITNLTFSDCSALYGGAVFIYSPSTESPVRIKSCDFTENTARGRSGSDSLYGGSALYLVCVNSEIVDCRFNRNKGSGGAVKISDDFASVPKGLRMLQYESNETVGSIEIKGCSFEIEKSSDCSLYYSNNKQISKVNLMDCRFAGDLNKDAHHIDGQSIDKDYSNLVINSCTFSDENRALSKFIRINMIDDRILANRMVAKQQISSKLWLSVATLMFAAIVVITLVIRRQTNEDELDNHDDQNSSLNL